MEDTSIPIMTNSRPIITNITTPPRMKITGSEEVLSSAAPSGTSETSECVFGGLDPRPLVIVRSPVLYDFGGFPLVKLSVDCVEIYGVVTHEVVTHHVVTLAYVIGSFGRIPLCVMFVFGTDTTLKLPLL